MLPLLSLIEPFLKGILVIQILYKERPAMACGNGFKAPFWPIQIDFLPGVKLDITYFLSLPSCLVLIPKGFPVENRPLLSLIAWNHDTPFRPI